MSNGTNSTAEAEIVNPERDEALLTSVALGKTIVFFLYSCIVTFAVAVVGATASIGELSESLQAITLFTMWLITEAIVLRLVIREVLPGANSIKAEGFSETQVAVGATIISLAAWVWPSSTAGKAAFQLTFNLGIVAALALYFVVKSVVSGRIRWGVLAVLFIPVLQLMDLWWGRGA